MRVQDLQQFLSSFTEGSDAIKNAVIFVEKDGHLHARHDFFRDAASIHE